MCIIACVYALGEETACRPVPVANTVVDPEAVMVKVIHAAVTPPTVFGTDRLHQTTRVAHEEDRVVQIRVLTPR